MKREIKFRYWDHENQEMIPINLGDRYGKFRKEYEVMQYTGLKCNGYEWYEGDILENDGDWYEITWDNDQARWEATGIGSTGESMALCELLSSESWVQGNRYENPDLLPAPIERG